MNLFRHRARSKRSERRLRLLDDEVLVREYVDRIETAHLLGHYITEVMETLYRIRTVCGKRKESGVPDVQMI